MSAPDRECISTHCDSHYKEWAALYGLDMFLFFFPTGPWFKSKTALPMWFKFKRSPSELPAATRVKLVAVRDELMWRQNKDELLDSLLKQWVRRSEEAKHCVE